MKSSVRTRHPIGSKARGFTLIEVMVALVITAIGLLGIAKIQALAYASTGSSGVRSLVAVEAAGLAASMHANRNYWSGSAPAVVHVTQTNVDDATLAGPGAAAGYCNAGSGNTPCGSADMAAFDLYNYRIALNKLLVNLNPTTTITCVAATPVNCQIQITWNEHSVSINQQSAAATTQTTFAPTYTLYVEP